MKKNILAQMAERKRDVLIKFFSPRCHWSRVCLKRKNMSVLQNKSWQLWSQRDQLLAEIFRHKTKSPLGRNIGLNIPSLWESIILRMITTDILSPEGQKSGQILIEKNMAEGAFFRLRWSFVQRNQGQNLVGDKINKGGDT